MKSNQTSKNDTMTNASSSRILENESKNDKISNSTKDSYNEQSNNRMKDFIQYAVNPDNNAYYTERSNHLSSKGD